MWAGLGEGRGVKGFCDAGEVWGSGFSPKQGGSTVLGLGNRRTSRLDPDRGGNSKRERPHGQRQGDTKVLEY